MVREELVSSAVNFLQDPSVTSSPLDKKIAFLQSKNLTQEEIDLALARAGEDVTRQSATAQQPSAQSSAVTRAAAPPGGYGIPPYGQWQPPPELPKRDWRDWFIMATVTGGVGYALYTLAKRYVVPLIAPPTPPQLEQDKQSIDEQFNRAFALIEQLSNDTAALKSAEEARTQRLDAALHEVESVVSELKTASRRRDETTRHLSDELRLLKDSIPKALEGAREGNENRLKELSAELKSLKVLLNNRLQSTSSGATSSSPIGGLGRTLGSATTESATTNGTNTTSTPSDSGDNATPSATVATGGAGQAQQQSASATSSSPLSQLGRAPASIPAWQMAAANRAKAANNASTEQTQGGSS
ncbi:hypothetical protein VTN31DRAFT_1359 [Thermomyces dupontii]|uniref:uncharacterized protein n=1 Tax=Talaromyces thermophilus TaxID=28565 RepID=UPI003742C104